MSSSEDSDYYGNYYIAKYSRDDPSLNKKRSRIIFCVVENDLEGLKSLLDSPKWYRVRDRNSYTILQIAILQSHKQIFDYVLSLDGFPIDATNRRKETALKTSLTGFMNDGAWPSESYAQKLLQRDVRIDSECPDLEGNTFLHYSFRRNFIQAARLLIEKGADVNAQNYKGSTPLHWCLAFCSGEALIEGVAMLLCCGAEPLLRDCSGESPFEVVLKRPEDVLVQEIMLYYALDESSSGTIGLNSLLEAAQQDYPFFYQLLGKISKINIRHIFPSTVKRLFSIETHYLKVLINKFDYAIEHILMDSKNQMCEYDASALSLKNFEVLVKSRLRSAVIDFISRADSTQIITDLIRRKTPLSVTSEIICFLLSYGMSIRSEDFQLIYKHFGYCELFRIFLYMDVEMTDFEEMAIIPALFYDVNAHVDTFLKDPDKFSTDFGIEALLAYSAHPDFKDFCYKLGDESLIERARRLPQIPLLIELSRDVFRKYFIKKLNIITSRQFYTMLKLLPVNEIYKKIVSFEKKLYY